MRNNGPEPRATIRDVAEDCGVSRQTVSNVLNFPERVSVETSARVLRSVERLGYRPDRAARNLVSRRAGMVGYCLGSSSINTVMAEFLRALCAASAESDGHVLLFTAPAGLAGMDVYSDLFAQRAVDAFILADVVDGDPRHQWLAERGIPFASFGRTSLCGDDQAGPWVDVDGADATARLVSGLHTAGHRSIAFLSWADGSGAGNDRARGGLARCRELGLSGTAVVSARDNTPDAGELATGELLDSANPPTAVVAASDDLAIGAQRAAAARGLRLAVTGFDDSPMAAVVSPTLTSVRQPVTEVARTLLALLTTTGIEQGVLLPGTIVSRESAPMAPGRHPDSSR